MSDITNVAAKAAKAAGTLLLEGREHISGILVKEDHSLASDLDRASEKLLRQHIAKAFPTHAILGEEDGGSIDINEEFLWVIDPLDGTHNLLRGLPLFAVSVGVLRRGEFIAGAIYMPLADSLYLGEKGQGATRNGQRIHVTDKTALADCSLVFDSGFRHFDQEQFDTLQALAPQAFNTRVTGCSVGNLAWLAEGAFDAIVEFDDHPWDYAAGMAIVEAAGGRISAPDGAPFRFGERAYIASNGAAHQEILAQTRETHSAY
jgi:myo-inositol-1(or 4)-monophosphatase